MRSLKWLFLFLIPCLGWAQPTTFMTWNLLNFDVSSTDRVPHYRTVIDSMQPELLAVQEVQGQAAANYFKQEVIQGQMAMAPFIQGPDSDNALFYDSLVFSVVHMQVIPTTLRDIAWYGMRHLATGDTLHVFSVHLKSSTGSANQQQRLSEVNALRVVTDGLPLNSSYIVCGDFNLYGSTEPAYQRLLEQNGPGHVVDPITMTGTWNTSAYAPHHTQSPRTRAFGGGASGGMDDRFDLILFSPSMASGGAVQYVSGSTWAVGNDGQHFNDSINAPPNTSVSQAMANAIHYASDHLPVVASFQFYETSVSNTTAPVFTVYPNPSEGRFTLSLAQVQGTCNYQVFDVAGKKVLHGSGKGSVPLQIDLQQQPSGMYVLQLIAEDMEKQVKLVKE